MATQAECEGILAELLDFSKPFNTELFDKVVDGFYLKGNRNLEQVIFQFTNHEMAWTRVDAILEHSKSNNARIVALNSLETVVRSKWNIIPAEQRNAIKNFIVSIILKISSDEQQMRVQAGFLNKLNVVLVQIAKFEWPKHWPTFIHDIVESSKTSQSICSNNMQILLLLSEEVFDYSRDQMTSRKVQLLRDTLNKDFEEIFQLCSFILGNSENPNLLLSTLKTLLRFIRWIPVQYIFEQKLLETLALKFFPVELFQVPTLRCLCEVASLNTRDQPGYNPNYDVYFVGLLTSVMARIYERIPHTADLTQLYQQGTQQFQSLLRYTGIFLSEIIKSHVTLFESANDDSRHALRSAIALLLRLSLIDDMESDVVIFNICLEFWISFLRGLYEDLKNSRHLGGSSTSPLMLNTSSRLSFYEDALIELRQVMISRMSKPEEVLVVTDENGNAVRETLKNTDSINLYISMREALIYLTHIDCHKTMEMMCGQLTAVVAAPNWEPEKLNRLCWAIGSISKALTDQQEKIFLARVIKELLSLVDKKTKKEHKAIIAANIMYVVGQYPRFLKNHVSFLTTVIQKLFEFMHEKHPGVQDMACDTYLKIASKCRSAIVTSVERNVPPFIETILDGLQNNIKDLEPAQVLVFYEATARIIYAEHSPMKREPLLFKLMEIPNRVWVGALASVKDNIDKLWDNQIVTAIEMVLKTNTRVAGSMKGGYSAQLSRIYVEMLQVYKLYSSYVSRQILEQGEVVTKTVSIRRMRSIKKEVLRILTCFVENCKQDMVVYEKFLPELIGPVLEDYKMNCPAARDPEVIQVFTMYVQVFKQAMVPQIPMIFGSLFVTLEMITNNFEDFPEHRIAFFNLIHAVADNCFEALVKLGDNEFKLVMDSVFWSMKHLDRVTQEIGLSALDLLLTNFQKCTYANAFYKRYLVTIINELLEVLTDTFHKSSFHTHVKLLANIIRLVESNSLTIPLDESYPTNSAFIKTHIARLFRDSFENLANPQIEALVTSLFATCTDRVKFSNIVKDFLIQLKEFASFEEEMQLEEMEKNALKQKQELYASVTGLEYTRGIDNDDE